MPNPGPISPHGPLFACGGWQLVRFRKLRNANQKQTKIRVAKLRSDRHRGITVKKRRVLAKHSHDFKFITPRHGPN